MRSSHANVRRLRMSAMDIHVNKLGHNATPGCSTTINMSERGLLEYGAASANVSCEHHLNITTTALPKQMTFNDDSLVSVIAYSTLFVIAAFGNLTVFITLFRNRHRKSRVNMFIMHLSIADLIVTFIMLPLETAWHITVAWEAGDVACRVLMFFRAFGFYLSSFILVTISLDRYFAILHPLSLTDADKRGKLMLGFAWIFSVIASTPQSVIFHVEQHPAYRWYTQCVTFNFFPTPGHELAYNLFNIITIYGLPLIVIIVSYSLIIIEMTKKSRESLEETTSITDKTRGRLRRSGVGNIERARIRTLKMTIMIVMVFILCWTPYFVISAWWWFDKESAKNVDPKVQRGLFLFAVSNSCMDPIVYGMFTIDFKRELKRCCCCINWKADIRRDGTLTSQAGLLRHGTMRTQTTSLRDSVRESYSTGILLQGAVRNERTLHTLTRDFHHPPQYNNVITRKNSDSAYSSGSFSGQSLSRGSHSGPPLPRELHSGTYNTIVTRPTDGSESPILILKRGQPVTPPPISKVTCSRERINDFSIM